MSVTLIVIQLLVTAIAVLHFVFAKAQWQSWPEVCHELTNFTDGEIVKTTFLGKSLASYNASIGAGLVASVVAMVLSFKNEFIVESVLNVQTVVLALIVLTAIVGWRGTMEHSNKILVRRLLPSAAIFFIIIAARIFILG